MYKEIFDYIDKIVPDPKCELNYNKDYELLIAVMLSAQTTDKRVNMVTKELFSKYNSLKKLKKAEINEIEKIVRSLGSYTKKSRAVIEIARQIDEWGFVPNDREKLEELPMVGRKTVSVVLSELFKEPNIAVDTHVERVTKRLGISEENASVLEVEKSLKDLIPKEKWCNAHLQLVHFGRYHCTSRNPNCKTCELISLCKHKKK